MEIESDFSDTDVSGGFTSGEDEFANYSRGRDCNQYVSVTRTLVARNLFFRVRSKLGKGLFLAVDRCESVQEMIRWHIVLVFALREMERVKEKMPRTGYHARVRRVLQSTQTMAEKVLDFKEDDFLRIGSKYTWSENNHFNCSLSSPYQGIENTLKVRKLAKRALTEDYDECLQTLGEALTRNLEDPSHLIVDGSSRGSLRPQPFTSIEDATNALELLKTKDELPPHMWPRDQFKVVQSKNTKALTQYTTMRRGNGAVKKDHKMPVRSIWRRFETTRYIAERYMREKKKREKVGEKESQKEKAQQKKGEREETAKKRRLDEDAKILPGLIRLEQAL